MIRHLPELVKNLDAQIGAALKNQVSDAEHKDFGGVMMRFSSLNEHHVDPRACGHALSAFAISYTCSESAYYLSERVKSAIDAVLVYLWAHKRPGGLIDLSGCNFASAPDTAFMLNHTLIAYQILIKRRVPQASWLIEPLGRWILSCAEGIRDGGFHTPNHRWAIASCLLTVSKLFDRADFAARANEYLHEGLDINSDGEFAERSAGNYNQVNDDQMIRLFLATGEKKYLEAARANLEMMYCYIDPDETVFTNNSTRQDYGRKVYLDSYYHLFLLLGYFLGEEKYGAMAQWLYQSARQNGQIPFGVEWLLLYEDLDGYGAEGALDKPFLRYDRLFAESKIARVRRGDYSLTLMAGKANFLYFQHGALVVYMVIYDNVCEKRNFKADKMEKTATGYRLTATADSWYYLPYYPDTPATSDWWAMDNEHTRKRLLGTPLRTVIDVTPLEDGVDIRLRTEGLDQVPLRVEFGFTPGCEVRTPNMLLEGRAGQSVTMLNGSVQLRGPRGDAISILDTFGRHNVMARSGGAYPQSDEHFTVYLTDYTPFDRTLRLRAQEIFPITL